MFLGPEPKQSLAFRTFQAVPIAVDDDAKSCFSNNEESIAIFMLGRLLSDYQLYVNGRKYGWGNERPEIGKIENHLLYCLDMDEVLYEDEPG